MKKHISLDEHLQLVANKVARKFVGIPTSMGTFDFHFESKVKLSEFGKSNIPTINPIE